MVSPIRGNPLQEGKSKGHGEVPKNTIFLVSRSFKLIIFIYVFRKPPINNYRDWIFIMLLPKPVRPVDAEKKGKDS